MKKILLVLALVAPASAKPADPTVPLPDDLHSARSVDATTSTTPWARFIRPRPTTVVVGEPPSPAPTPAQDRYSQYLVVDRHFAQVIRLLRLKKGLPDVRPDLP